MKAKGKKNSAYKKKQGNIIFEGKKIILRSIKLTDVSKEYVNWLNSKEIKKFLESRFIKYTLDSLKNYIKKISKDPNIIFMAIIEKERNSHIGNIKMGPIDWNHKNADIGIIIGDKKSWGKGYATEAIQLISDYGFRELNLHKITAGAYSNNTGSIKAFLKAGFYEECKRKNHFNYNGKYIDGILLAKFKN